MKKSHMLVGAVLAVLGIVTAGKALTAKADLLQYIDPPTSRNDDFLHILTAARVMHVTDVPGLYAQFGDEDEIKHLVEAEEGAEDQAYRPVAAAWFTPPMYGKYRECAIQMHDENLAALAAVKKVVASRMGDYSIVDDMLKAVFSFDSQQAHCQVLVRSAEADLSSPASPAPTAQIPPPSSHATTPTAIEPTSKITATGTMKERLVPLLLSVPAVGDPEGTQSEIDVLAHPKTLEDWQFLSGLDEDWATTDCSESLCTSQYEALAKAEAQIKKNRIVPPAGVQLKFLILAIREKVDR